MLGGINSAGENRFYPNSNTLCITRHGRYSLLALCATVASSLALETIILAQSPSSTVFTPSLLPAKKCYQGNCRDSLILSRLS